MERITTKDLEAVCKRINHTVNGLPDDAPLWTRDPAKRHLSATIGMYYVDCAYGGYALYRMANEGGGVSEVFPGHMPKRELYNRMQAFLRGYEAAQCAA